MFYIEEIETARSSKSVGVLKILDGIEFLMANPTPHLIDHDPFYKFGSQNVKFHCQKYFCVAMFQLKQ